MKHRILNRTLSAFLAAAMTAAMALPAYASGKTSYTEGEKEFEILWTEGITAPDPGKGSFTAGSVSYGDTALEVLTAGYEASKGWFDLTQTPQPEESQEEGKEPELKYNSGYAAAAANAGYWWMGLNREKISGFDKEGAIQTAPASQSAQDDKLYKEYLEKHPEQENPDVLINETLSQLFNAVLGDTVLSQKIGNDFAALKAALEADKAVILSVKAGEQQRFVNLWGLETDEEGALRGLFVTDSQDEFGMVRYGADQLEIREAWALDGGKTQWDAYVPAESQPSESQPGESQPGESQPDQPQWEDPQYHWSEDLSTCTAKRTAKGDASQVETEQVTPSKEQTKAPTSDQPGVMTYTADFQADWAETQTETRDIPKTETRWNAPVYKWNEDFSACTATRTSQDDPSLEETAQGEVSGQVTVKATCTAPGEKSFTATFKEDWAEPQKKTAAVPALDHDWGEPSYQWSQDHKNCKAVRVCRNDNSHQDVAQGSVTWEQTRKPTSKTSGETTYTAKFSASWTSTQKEAVEDVPALAPQWGEPTYQWSSDFTACTATRVDRVDPERKETADAKVTSRQSKDPTVTSMGETTYTAEFDAEWAKTQTSVQENVPKLTPEWGETEYQWSPDHRGCAAVRVAKNDKNYKESSLAKVSSQVVKKPTMDEMGETTYTAEFTVDWAQKQVTTVRDIPQLSASWHPTEYVWSGDYLKCTAVRRHMEDKNLVERSEARVTSKKTKAPTNNMRGETTYTAEFDVDWAAPQKKVVSNIAAIPDNPHGRPQPSNPTSWNEPTYEWSEDHSRCTARRTKKGDESNVDLTWATVTKKEVRPATCGEPGEAIYTASFTEKWAKTQTVKGEIPTLEHTLKKVEEVQATAAREGMQEHYECQVCHKLFTDPKGQREVTKEQLKLSRPSVSQGYAILNGVPEKDSVVALSAKKFSAALKENPGSVGVSISVGSSSVTYDKKDVETIVAAAGDHDKLQLEIRKVDASDSALTLDQIHAGERNPGADQYLVMLSYVENGKNVPITGLSGCKITVPYAGTDAVRPYLVAEDGSFREVSGRYQNSFLTFEGENGIYLLSEKQPVTEAAGKSGSKVGVIIWSTVLVISGLLVIGLLGFYFYQKKLEGEVVEGSDLSDDFGSLETRVGQSFPGADVPAEEPVPEDDFQQILDEEFPDLEELLKESPTPVEEVISGGAEPEKPAAKPRVTPEAKTPLAPRAPMEKKPTIAEKTAESVNSKNHKA